MFLLEVGGVEGRDRPARFLSGGSLSPSRRDRVAAQILKLWEQRRAVWE